MTLYFDATQVYMFESIDAFVRRCATIGYASNSSEDTGSKPIDTHPVFELIINTGWWLYFLPKTGIGKHFPSISEWLL